MLVVLSMRLCIWALRCFVCYVQVYVVLSDAEARLHVVSHATGGT